MIGVAVLALALLAVGLPVALAPGGVAAPLAVAVMAAVPPLAVLARRRGLAVPAPSRRGVVRRGAAILAVCGIGLLASGAPPGVALVALLPAALRVSRGGRRGRTVRGLRECSFVGIALLLAAPSPATLLAAAGGVLAAAVGLPVVLAAGGAGRRRLPGLPAGLAAAVAVALVASALFVLLPRRTPGVGAGPEGRSLSAAERPGGRTAEPGVGGRPQAMLPARTVGLGDIGRLQRDLRPLLEVRFRRDGRVVDAEAFGPLLRAVALEEFDGRRWQAAERAGRLLRDGTDEPADGWIGLPGADALPARGVAVDQELRFLAGGSDSLFCLGLPLSVGGSAVAGGVLAASPDAVRAVQDVGEGDVLLARCIAVPGPYAALRSETLTAGRRRRLLELPPGHERTVTLARQVVGDAAGPEALRRVEAELVARCRYSLEIEDAGRVQPVEHFLFTARRGHCELFAAAAAVMLRAGGIPARLAIGFRGGAWDGTARRYRFSGADAHAWVEAHLPGQGWTVFDPTPGDGVAEVDGAEGPSAAAAPPAPSLLERLLRFDGEFRTAILEGALAAVARAGRGATERSTLPWLLTMAGLGAAWWAVRARRALAPAASPQAPPPPMPAALRTLEARLRPAGLVRGRAETVLEFGERAVVAGAAPPEALRDVTAGAGRERWGGVAPDGPERERLEARARSVEPPRT